MKSKRIDIIFSLLLMLILLTGLLTTLFRPRDINAYENRYAEKISKLTGASYADGSFQDSMEKALSDQVQLAQLAKKTYNFSKAFATVPVVNALEDWTQNYVYTSEGTFYNGKIVYGFSNLETLKPWLTQKAENLNAAFAAYSDIEFYVYYIEKDTDINFVTGEKLGASQFIFSKLNLDDAHKSIYEINSFEEFDERFYDTDHHWNYIGSYEGYKEVLSLISDDEPLEPTGVFHSGLRFAGSKAMALGKLFTDEMSIYRFNYPPMTIQVNGNESDYGHQKELLSGELGAVSYGAVYGDDEAEVIFDTGKDGDNILIIGESYDNAILKLIAGHFAKTYSIDLRHYEVTFGEKFNFNEYVRQHGITKVLLIGNVDYFLMSEFMI